MKREYFLYSLFSYHYQDEENYTYHHLLHTAALSVKLQYGTLHDYPHRFRLPGCNGQLSHR